MIRVLIVGGNTGREYAIIKNLHDSVKAPQISTYQWAYNPHVQKVSKQYTVGDVRDTQSVLKFAKSTKPDFAFIGQGESMESGICDLLEKEGIPCIGSRKEVAKVESSKEYCLELVSKVDQECVPKYKCFPTYDEDKIKGYIQSLGQPRIVVKYDGLINSKGVKIYNLEQVSIETILMQCKSWITETERVVIEEFVEGKEVSVISYVDGNTILHSPPVRNYKRVFDNDLGENTSGMGAVTTGKLLPFMNQTALNKIHLINEEFFKFIRTNIDPDFKGALYGEFFITPDNQIRLIEYNTRFGNPSTINQTALLEQNMMDLFEAIINRSLGSTVITWREQSTISAYAVPEGYPYTKVNVGVPLDLSSINIPIYYSMIDYAKNNASLNSRLFALCVTGNNLQDLNQIINQEMSKCRGKIHWRRDLGVVL